MTEADEVNRVKRGIEKLLVRQGATRKESRDKVSRIARQTQKPTQEDKSDE